MNHYSVKKHYLCSVFYVKFEFKHEVDSTV